MAAPRTRLVALVLLAPLVAAQSTIKVELWRFTKGYPYESSAVNNLPDAGSAACSEVVSGTKQDGYRGCQTKTVSGKTCQKWTAQSPHRHSRTPSKYPNKGLGDHNYCRNPDGEGGGIWCYTTSASRRWEYCDPLLSVSCEATMNVATIDYMPNYRPTAGGCSFSTHFAARFTGSFRAPNSGTARFWTTSDDGSFLYVDGQLVVSNGGYHGARERSGSVSVVRGDSYSWEVRFFQGGGGTNIKVEWQPPGSGRMLLRGELPSPPPPAPPPPLDVGARRKQLAAANTQKPMTGTTIGVNRPFTLRCWCPQPLRIGETSKTPVAAQFRNRCVVEASDLVLTQQAGSDVKGSALVDKLDLHRNLGHPLSMIWVRGAKHHFGVVDGRDETPKIGSLGGDLGEFVIGLAAYESLHNANLEVWYGQGSKKVELSYQDVAKMLFYHLLWSGPTKIAFSYPTDETRLARAVEYARRYRWWGHDTMTEEHATDKPYYWGQWWALLHELPQPYSQGSEFWSLLTSGVDASTGAALGLGVRPQLARHAIRAFFEIMWYRNYRGWTMLTEPKILKLKGRSPLLDGGGDAQEAAWLNIKTKTTCNDDQSVPLVSSSGRLGSRYYVYHEQWVKKQRAGLAVNLAAFDVRVDPQQLQGYMDQIEATGKKVLIEQAVRSTFTPSRALPTWDVTFRAIETSTVESSTPAPAPPAPPAEEWAGAALPWEVS